MSTLDPASRELLAAIAAVLDAQPKPASSSQVGEYLQRVSDRAAIVRVAVTMLLAHGQDQDSRARHYAAELRAIAAARRPPGGEQP